jgi:hypothetical protein
MSLTVNKATGEVTFDLHGKEYRLRASLSNLARMQAESGIEGFAEIARMLQRRDARVIYWGLSCLCVSGNARDFDDMLLMPVLNEVCAALQAALVAGLPDLEQGDVAGEA